MNSPHLIEIEHSISVLSLEEQEWLLERIAKKIKAKKQQENKFNDCKYMSEQLAQMASDVDIQSEIKLIHEEFIVTEMDGLEKL